MSSTSTSTATPLTLASFLPMTPQTSHSYTTTLIDPFCIGTVPNGGYITSAFLLAAAKHMTTTHPTLSCPDPINVHLQFLRRTAVGPATFTVQDIKLGRRISNLHLTLSQPDDADETKHTDRVQGYITLSNFAHETGPSRDTRYHLHSPPLPADLAALSRDPDHGDPYYIRRRADPYGGFRRASRHTQMHLLRPAVRASSPAHDNPAAVDQWVRFRPQLPASFTFPPSSSSSSSSSSTSSPSSSSKNPQGGETLLEHAGRWTNASLGYLADIFPQVNEQFANRAVEDLALQPSTAVSDAQIYAAARDGRGSPLRTFWYPTLLLNLDVKKQLPADGVDWLFVRCRAKKIANGRFDLEVEVWDEGGDLVALSTHAALILDMSRNTKRGGKGGADNKGAKEKESKI